jgi:peptide/nickel transport system permease protein
VASAKRAAIPLAVPEREDDVLVLPRHTPMGLFWIRFRRNKPAILGAIIVGGMVFMAVAANVIAPYDPSQQDYAHLVQGPGGGHILGTDDLGRDSLSRIIFGARLAVAASVFPVLLALVVGVPLGLIAGYFRGFWDEWIIMRVVDAMQAFPFLILALALAAVLGASFTNAVFAIGVAFIPGFVRIIRGQVLSVTACEYIQSARALGVSNARILRAHVLPNTLGPLLVLTSVAMAAAILAEAGLAYLGVSGQVGTSSWGQMLTIAQGFIYSAPWLALWPGLAIFLAVLGFNLLGDGIRDGLDPRLTN